MSTQKIREALAMCAALPLADVAQAVIEEARAEVEAIEAALSAKTAKPPAQRSCNLHVDCDAADAAATVVGRSSATHCNDAGCSDHA